MIIIINRGWTNLVVSGAKPLHFSAKDVRGDSEHPIKDLISQTWLVNKQRYKRVQKQWRKWQMQTYGRTGRFSYNTARSGSGHGVNITELFSLEAIWGINSVKEHVKSQKDIVMKTHETHSAWEETSPCVGDCSGVSSRNSNFVWGGVFISQGGRPN